MCGARIKRLLDVTSHYINEFDVENEFIQFCWKLILCDKKMSNVDFKNISFHPLFAFLDHPLIDHFSFVLLNIQFFIFFFIWFK
jgi:hypothetical protein